MQDSQHTSAFLDACMRRPVARTPAWYMRQAGRCLPAYRALRQKHGILTLARTPEIATEISLMPVREFGVDAAILFADIVLPLAAIGIDVDLVDSVGPVIRNPIASETDLARLRPFEPRESMAFLGKTIGMLRGELPARVPLIGFSGAPFTLATYLIEGGPSKDLAKTRAFILQQPQTWEKLMRLLTDVIVEYLGYQIDSGVQAVQLFDSWAGRLSADEYRALMLPYSREIFSRLGARVPRIHFGTLTRPFLREFGGVDCEVVGIDSGVPMAEAWELFGGTRAIQGNLDPRLLLGDFAEVRAEVDRIFAAVNGRAGFIFNLGHGVLPETDPDMLKRLTDYVHGK